MINYVNINILFTNILSALDRLLLTLILIVITFWSLFWKILLLIWTHFENNLPLVWNYLIHLIRVVPHVMVTLYVSYIFNDEYWWFWIIALKVIFIVDLSMVSYSYLSHFCKTGQCLIKHLNFWLSLCFWWQWQYL